MVLDGTLGTHSTELPAGVDALVFVANLVVRTFRAVKAFRATAADIRIAFIARTADTHSPIASSSTMGVRTAA